MSSNVNLGSSRSLPDTPCGPQKVADGCWMVGHRNPESMLQCNTYIRTFRQFGSARNVCIDPGSQFDFSVVESNVSKVIGDMSEVHAMTINHQDPDVAGNAPLFCEAAPHLEMIVSEEVWRLLQHMMLQPGRVRLSHGTLSTSTQQPFQFVPTPFCHFRGAMALYDPEQRILYSGDLFGGLNQLGRVQLLAEESDWAGIAQFHQIYMPSREVLRYAVRQILNLRPRVEVIAPQHGHIITGELVGLFLERMHELLVGNDLLAEDWDSENRVAYQEVLQRVVDLAIEERGEVNVVGRLNTHATDDDLASQVRLRGRELLLDREGYSSLGKVFLRLTEGEREDFINELRQIVMKSCEEFGLPIPPLASGFRRELATEAF